MTVIRRIGLWDGPEADEGWPDVCGFVGVADPVVVAYLRAGTPYATAAGLSVCRLCGARNGSAELTDGVHFAWPEGLAHYVEAHGVQLPDEVAAVAAKGAAAVPTAEHLTVDATWWQAQAGQDPATHLPGCRRSAVRAGWEAPTEADIFIDLVPLDAVTTLVKLRKLLGTAWPMSELRGLLGAQPFLAVPGGDPRALWRRLDGEPDLRRYLFYGSAEDRSPVWPGVS